jgi:hypothetical protein
MLVQNINGGSRGEIVAMDRFNDLCLIKTDYIEMNPMPVAYHKPKKHQKYYNIAAPDGLWGKNYSIMFEGYFTGYDSEVMKVQDLPPGWPTTFCQGDESVCIDKKKYVAIWGIAAAPGSSGSPIFNKNGELVGIISMATNDHNISLGAPLVAIKKFLAKNM